MLVQQSRMNAGGDNGEGEFGSSVDDAFLAGFEAWGELGQVRVIV